MAAIEKVCECSNKDCTYHGGDMWKYKYNHLQINPECRGKYFGKEATVYFLNPQHLGSERYYAYSKCGRSMYGSLQKSDDLYFNGKLYNEEHYIFKRKPYMQEFLTPVRKVFNFEIMVVVDDEVFYNTVWDMRKFKLNMLKMFGKGNVAYKRLNKKLCKNFEYSNKVFKTVLDDKQPSNTGFDKMVDYVVKNIE